MRITLFSIEIAIASTLLVAGCGHSSGDGELGTVSRADDGLLRDFEGKSEPKSKRELVRTGEGVEPVVIERGEPTSRDRGPVASDVAREERRPSEVVIERGSASRSTRGYDSRRPEEYDSSAIPIERGSPVPSEPLPPAAAGYARLTVRVDGANECWVSIQGVNQGEAPLEELEVRSGASTIDIVCGNGRKATRAVMLGEGEHKEVVVKIGGKTKRRKRRR